MKLFQFAQFALLWSMLTVPSLAADTPTLDVHLEALRPLLEKTWKGEFKNSTPDKPTVDVARWERALNGRAVRILHSINDGVYGGEMMILWNETKQQLDYFYFTTAGFTTTGTMQVTPNGFTTHEVVNGSSGGTTEVRATSELHPDGTLHVKSEYLKNGKWGPGHEVTYHQDPAAKVVFK